MVWVELSFSCYKLTILQPILKFLVPLFLSLNTSLRWYLYSKIISFHWTFPVHLTVYVALSRSICTYLEKLYCKCNTSYSNWQRCDTWDGHAVSGCVFFSKLTLTLSQLIVWTTSYLHTHQTKHTHISHISHKAYTHITMIYHWRHTRLTYTHNMYPR